MPKKPALKYYKNLVFINSYDKIDFDSSGSPSVIYRNKNIT